MKHTQNSGFTLYPLILISACFAAGIVLTNIASPAKILSVSICVVFAILTAVFIRTRFVLLFLATAFVFAGALCSTVSNESVSTDRLKILFERAAIESGDPIEFEGVLLKPPEQLVGGIFLLIGTEKAVYKDAELTISGDVRVFAPIQDTETGIEYESLELDAGAKVSVACNLSRENNFQNPGVNLQIEILDQQNIDAVCTLKSPILLRKIGSSHWLSPAAAVYRLRQSLINDIRQTFSPSTAGVLSASLLGNKYFLDKNTAELFREGGTFHVLVISGLHITFIGGIILLFARRFTDRRILQFLVVSAALWTYAFAVGAQVPVVRASLMFSIILFSAVIYRRGTPLNSLGACILVLLIWRPDDLFSQSFHMTVVSVSAIIAFAFPLIEKMRAIGSWMPSAESPFPPRTPETLKRICETIYWREDLWKRNLAHQIWDARLFKSPYFGWIAKKGLQKPVRYLFEGVVISSAVQISLLPLLIYYFHRLSFFGVILNLWVGINVAAESFAAIAAALLSKFSMVLSAPFVKLTKLLNWILISIPQFLVERGLASARIPVYSGNMKPIYLLYFLPLIVLAMFLTSWNPFEKRSKLKTQESRFRIPYVRLFQVAAVFTALLFAIIVFHPFSAPAPDGRLHVEFLDVGQGDSIFVTFPTGETMLVDGGGRLNFNKILLKGDDESETVEFEPDSRTIGESVVSEFLWQKGYSKIDFIVSTHPDADHIQGLADVARNFAVKRALFSGIYLGDEEFDDLYGILESRKIESSIVSRGEYLEFGNARVDVLSLSPENTPKSGSTNNSSLVLRIVFGNRSFLLSGDIEKEAEKELVQNTKVQSDVVKVAHHGSRTSSINEFVDAVKANYAVISVGRTSRFGHPHAEVVERWQLSGAKVFKTGDSGTISFSTDGIDLRIEKFLK